MTDEHPEPDSTPEAEDTEEEGGSDGNPIEALNDLTEKLAMMEDFTQNLTGLMGVLTQAMGSLASRLEFLEDRLSVLVQPEGSDGEEEAEDATGASQDESES